MTHAVVTGGAGFIGGHIAAALAAEGCRVTVVDNFRTGNRATLAGFNGQLIEGDIRDGAVLERAFRRADTVFHLAAALSVPESMEKPREYVDINTNGTLAHDIVRRMGSKSVIRNAPERSGDVMHSRASIDALMATGWKPQYPFAAALDETIAYYLRTKAPQ